MKQITIVPENGLVMIDGRGFEGLDMTSLASNIHAVQWYGNSGEIEYKINAQGVKPANTSFYSLDAYARIIALWEAEKDAADNPPPAPPPTIEEIQALLDAGLSTWIHRQIATRPDGTPGYASVTSAGNYIGNTVNPKWSLEGEKIRDWNAQCWAKALELLNTVLPQMIVGNREAPSLEEVIAEMPPFEWPVT
ncbi:hypothetical protein NB640_12435 [Oxalobacter vibrioformis]|uniref:Uncharacterized protein n=1 Tax=Oxalobacter vibrioformis TaxID=933080 RepID=A0A9E9LZB7_9BURK|nr:hypothetical protein [Oxalobacter vibrioformis]WAW10008.1 hypothetical protein NB640_12435 [Oxalobacter vibrioformis]